MTIYEISADGDYQITTKTKATVHYDGKIVWEPPMIYKSYCAINIEYYPFDIQDCYMKFGTWTFDGALIDLEHIEANESIPEKDTGNAKTGGVATKLYTVEAGIDMSDYYESVEWDILSIPAQKNIKYYDCCREPYYDIFFNITIRRKTLFYTVNLIIPCVNISFLSVLVFYLPSDCGEKLTLGISILVALLVFYLLLIELIPPTSLVIPLLGKYLLFTLILVNLSILLTIFILNLHHRKPHTHKMSTWMKRLILEILPKILMIERPAEDTHLLDIKSNKKCKETKSKNTISCLNESNNMHSSYSFDRKESDSTFENLKKVLLKRNISESKIYPKNILDALNGIEYINDQMKKEFQENKVSLLCFF
jgi:nicotinic acetylcholine receptor